MKVTALKYTAFLALNLLAETLFAQSNGTIAQNPLNAAPPATSKNQAPAPMFTPPPAWNTPEIGNSAPAFQPAPAPNGSSAPYYPPPSDPYAPTQPGTEPYTENQYYVPSQPAPSYDNFQEEDPYGYEAPSEGSSGGGNSHKVRDNMRFVEEPAVRNVCRKWGNHLTGPTTYSDRGKCEYELGRKVDETVASIEDLSDRFELLKIKKVIRGEIKSRNDARQYTMKFDSLRKTLDDAEKKGCTCLDK